MAAVRNLQILSPVFANANEMLVELERRRRILQAQIADTDDAADAANLFADYWALREAAEAIARVMKRRQR